MGGMGSGQYDRWNKKNRTSKSRPLDIRKLARNKHLISGTSIITKWSCNGNVYASIGGLVFQDHLKLQYKYRKEQINQKIYFDWTPCNYGGKRVWFICPFCHKRIAVIYGAGKYFACRKCHNLTYPSCSKPDYERILDKAYALRKKLGRGGNRYSPIPPRPKGMHKKTYKKIVEKIEQLEWIVEIHVHSLLNGG